MGWLFGGRRSRPAVEVLDSAWNTCANCPRRSRAGAPTSTNNCILAADNAYADVHDEYEHCDHVEFSYGVVDFYFYAGYTLVACCGQAAPKGTIVAKIPHEGERRHGIHHVLIVSAVVGRRGFWGGADWCHTVYDSNEDGSRSFDSLNQAKDWLKEKYSEMTDGRVDVSIEEYTGKGRLIRFLAELAEEFEEE